MIEINFDNLDAIREKISPKVVNKALAVAVSRGARAVSAEITRNIRDVFTAKASKIRSNTQKIRKITDTEYYLAYAGERLSLIDFRHSKVIRRYRTKGGKMIKPDRRAVKVGILKGRSPELYRKAFLGKGRGGGQHIFQRKGGASLPIVKLTGPAVAQMVQHRIRSGTINDYLRSRLQIEFKRAMEHYGSTANH